MVDAVTDLLENDGFRTGLLYGLFAGIGVALAAVLARRVLPWAGVAFVVAALLALDDRFAVPSRAAVALAVVAAGGILARRHHPALRALATVPGALLFVDAVDVRDPGWAPAAVLGVTVVGGALAAEFDRTFARSGLPPVLLALTVLGAYGTVPETQHIVILVGVALPVALLGWPVPLASLGAGGAAPALAVVAWISVVDGPFRPGSIVGALAGVGVLAVEPLVRWALRARGGAEAPDQGWPVLLVAGLHLALVGVCSRVAGMRTSAGEALALCAAAYVAAAVVLVVTDRRRRPARGRPSLGAHRVHGERAR